MNTTNRTHLTATATLLAVVAALAAGITMGHIQNSLASSKADAALRELDESKRARFMTSGAEVGETAVVPDRSRRFGRQSVGRNRLPWELRPRSPVVAEP